MTPTTQPATGRLKIAVSSDRLIAELRVPPTRAGPVTCEQISDAMQVAGLTPIAPEELSRIAEGVNAASLEPPIVIAQGRPAVDDLHAKLELAPELITEPTTPTSHYDRHHYLTAAAGQRIARIIPPVPGQDGQDVFGEVIPHRTVGQTATYFIGENITTEADGSLLAAIAGSVRFEKGRLWIDPVLDVSRNVDFSVGNIDFGGDVHIRGSVLDLFHVRSHGNIIIHGAVEAAEITAGLDIVVNGGVVGKEKGRCAAGRDLSLRHATGAILSAGRDIHGQIEIATSQVECGGLLDMKEGTILGGEIRARGGLRCGTLGCPHGTGTLVEVGTDPALRRSVVEQMAILKKLRKTSNAAREAVAPLLKNRMSLAARQKAIATELLHHAAEAETAVNEIVRTLRDAFAASRAAAKQEIRVTRRIHPGVTIRFPDMECTVDEIIPGAVRIVPRNLDGKGIAIYAVSEHGGYTRQLQTRHLRDDLMHAAEHALGSP